MTEQQIIETLATKVMGWIPKKDYFVGDKRIDCFLTDEGKRIAAYQWNPLQNIADAWMIVEKLREEGIFISIESHELGYEGVAREAGYANWIAREESSTAPKAISMTAYKLVA